MSDYGKSLEVLFVMENQVETVTIRDMDDLLRLQSYTTCIQYNSHLEVNVRDWIKTHCKGKVHISAAFLYFEDKQDATFYKLSHN
jgi:hypothetical protein